MIATTDRVQFSDRHSQAHLPAEFVYFRHGSGKPGLWNVHIQVPHSMDQGRGPVFGSDDLHRYCVVDDFGNLRRVE